uniref:C-type lectin domain-containing protein n=1 Tax=Gasterosteus aculeatus aculeatus TaxID=481459 RepID=A0AAQ4PLL4_GASAC
AARSSICCSFVSTVRAGATFFISSSVDPYTLVFEGMSWVEAQKFCRLHETDLASVRSLKESEEIQIILQENMEVWIGLHRDSWNWSDGTNFSFSRWLDGQPDIDTKPEACVSMLNGGWNDTLCSTGLYFILTPTWRTRPSVTTSCGRWGTQICLNVTLRAAPLRKPDFISLV